MASASISRLRQVSTRLPNRPLNCRNACRRWASVSALIRSRQALDRGQVEPAVLEGTPGELACLRHAKSRQPTEHREHAGHDGATAMHLQLRHVLAGLAVRCRKPQHQGLVDHLLPAGSRRRAKVARRGSGTRPMVAIRPCRAPGPEMRMTAIAAGGRPDESAKIVSRSLLKMAACEASIGREPARSGPATQSANGTGCRGIVPADRFWTMRTRRALSSSPSRTRTGSQHVSCPKRAPEPPRQRDQPLSAAAQIQSGRLVAVGPGRAGARPSAATSRSCSRSAMRPAIGATSWRTKASRTTPPPRS